MFNQIPDRKKYPIEHHYFALFLLMVPLLGDHELLGNFHNREVVLAQVAKNEICCRVFTTVLSQNKPKPPSQKFRLIINFLHP